jgi:hypothetical protein
MCRVHHLGRATAPSVRHGLRHAPIMREPIRTMMCSGAVRRAGAADGIEVGGGAVLR